MMKSHTKRFLSFLLALVLSFSLCVPAFAAGGFSDVPGHHWAYSDIMACAEAGIVKGYEDGSFHPGDNVTTVQFLVMMTRTFYANKLSEVVTPAGQPWYYANTKVAADVGMSENLTAVDNNPMNRYDMAMALSRTMSNFNKQATSVQIRNAAPQINDWATIAKSYTVYANAVANCYAKGILTGMSDGTFSGEQSMTRAQACAVIVRMMNLIGDSEPVAPVTPTQPEQPETPEQTTTGKLANGKDATTENVLEILEEIKEEYPDGTIWGDRNTPGTNYYANGYDSKDVRTVVRKAQDAKGGYCSTEYGCGGFAAMVSDRIFGQTGAPAREVTNGSKVRAGDIIINFNAKGQLTHVAIASENAHEISGNYGFTTCDGNSGGGFVTWGTGWNYLGVKSYGTVRAYTRYPD